ncbi:MAG: bifunctional 3-deoxy-7-phosphoheptulonate synthase/chorismate mutase type II [Bacteroidales bacterium]|nr:bifunctional 3-deoxy-7-phosphoheptulonate synthase/chorismate mutase type II [Bacteroidales bacterium]
MTGEKPYIVAGPCSVESREQLDEVVQALSRVPHVCVVRCGVWKPRTHPGVFEGLGEEALRWVAELKGRYAGLRFGCEVARAEHVEQALRYGMEVLWIGARTTANPFMVQEVAEAMRGSAATVMVKNAPSPDVQLWLGAVERLRQVGISDIMAVHRGFDLFKNGGYRNNPLWEVPIELRRLAPELPMLCDPSHIAGCRGPIATLSQMALNLGFDGLMIEVHPHPDKALTDAGQQITPKELEQLLERLIVPQTESSVANEQLQCLREEIDMIDEQVLQLMAARLGVAGKIAQVKKQGNLAVFQPKRWEQLLQQRRFMASGLGLDPGFVEELFEKIHAESVRVQLEK